MGLRRVPPSSEKMSHRRHRRNVAKCVPVRSACKVVAMRYIWMVDSILTTISISNLTLVFILWLVELSEQAEQKYNQ